MIPFASQRGGGQDLATHLQNAHDNELMEVVEIRGAIAEDLHGAFKEWEAQAEALTRCRKYLYSLSINPDPGQGEMTRDQYQDYIVRAEAAIGLTGQPRVIVFHTKHGREHCHVVWSRVDADHQRAVHIAFDREKLMRVTREFARFHFFDLPSGYDASRKTGQDTLYERALKSETGLSKADHMIQVTEAWRHSDNAPAFVQALADRGYILATGKRPYVVVDFYGGMHALSKLIDDKSVKTQEIRAFLEKEFPEDSLPSVEEAQNLAKKHRAFLERSLSRDAMQDRIDVLRHQQRLRRLAVEQEELLLVIQHKTDRGSLDAAHVQARRSLRGDYISQVRTTRDARNAARPTGLAAFLGKVSGVAAVRRAVHRYQDRKRLASHVDERSRQAVQHADERGKLILRHGLQSAAVERKKGDLEQIERRELASLKRDSLRNRRVQDRGAADSMPSFSEVLDPALLRGYDDGDKQKRGEEGDRSESLSKALNRASQGDGRLAPEDRNHDQGDDPDRGPGPRGRP